LALPALQWEPAHGAPFLLPGRRQVRAAVASVELAVAVLVLLAAAARAWLVAADLRQLVARRAGRLVHPQIFTTERSVIVGMVIADIDGGFRLLRLLNLFRRLHAHREQDAHHIFTD